MLFIVVLCGVVLARTINGRQFHPRAADSLVVMRDQCARNPYADECTRVKNQMEDLLRKCRDMATPVSACGDVKDKYCFIWPTELYCYGSFNGGGGTPTTRPPIWDSDPNWYQIPYDPNELKSRGDYCVSHQTEQKCRNLLSALKVRYDECARRPKTDVSCQSFKVNLCAAFPNFSPCLNGGAKLKRQSSRLEQIVRQRRKVQSIAVRHERAQYL